MDKEKSLQQLREILLGEDRKDVNDKFTELRDEVTQREKIEPRVEPIINEKMEELRENFPELFGPVITETIKAQIRNSRDEVVEALYPITGQLVRRYVQKELEALSDRLDKAIARMFSPKYWGDRIVSWVRGKPKDSVLTPTVANASIEQVFLVERESGLLLGSYAREESVDTDMVAAMLSAIKQFAEEAFASGAQEVHTIEYETFKILVFSTGIHFIAAVVSGIVTEEFKRHLRYKLSQFAEDTLRGWDQEISEENITILSNKLKTHLLTLNEKSQ